MDFPPNYCRARFTELSSGHSCGVSENKILCSVSLPPQEPQGTLLGPLTWKDGGGG